MTEIDVRWDLVNKGINPTFSNDDLTANIPNSNSNVRANKGKTNGKWYWEIKLDLTLNIIIGVCNASAPLTSPIYNNANNRGYAFDGKRTPSLSAYAPTYATGDIISVLLDLDNGKMDFWKNGVDLGVSHTDLLSLGEVFPCVSSGSSNNGGIITANFGLTPFSFNPPDEYSSYAFYHTKKKLVESKNKIYSLKTKERKQNPNMTSNTSPSPYIASANHYNPTYPAWKAFNGSTVNEDLWLTPAGVTNAWIQLDLNTPKKVNSIKITNRFITPTNPSAGFTKYTAPKDFEVLGSNDGVNFRLLKSVKDEKNWGNGEVRSFSLNTVGDFRYYRLHILNGNNDSGNAAYNLVGLSELEFFYIEGLTEIPVVNKGNFIEYGADSIESFDLILDKKSYILQDGVSENTDGLWVQKLSRKPLSIRIK